MPLFYLEQKMHRAANDMGGFIYMNDENDSDNEDSEPEEEESEDEESTVEETEEEDSK